MEIKVGEYVRTKDGVISKCIEEQHNKYIFDRSVDNEDSCFYINYIFKDIPERANFIVKHSPNIIDLIEEGDYVTSYDGIEGKVYIIMPPLKIFIDGDEVLSEEIKTIITHEQMKEMEYML